MTAPAEAAARFGAACLLGAGLGLLYGFLRPLRPRRTTLADSIFVLCTFFCWLILCFDICRGDIRMGYVLGLAVGGFGWEMTFGRLLRPVFFQFWKLLAWLWHGILAPGIKIMKKIRIFAKKYLCILEKMGYNKME